jgi:hypothetical protein
MLLLKANIDENRRRILEAEIGFRLFMLAASQLLEMKIILAPAHINTHHGNTHNNAVYWL